MAKKASHANIFEEVISSKYNIEEKVGEGTYGWVYKASTKVGKQPVAIKKFKTTKDGEGLSLTAYREVMVTIRYFSISFHLVVERTLT